MTTNSQYSLKLLNLSLKAGKINCHFVREGNLENTPIKQLKTTKLTINSITGNLISLYMLF